jgi:hypothetical protein
MGTQFIEDPITKESIPFEWNSDTPPTSEDINGLYQAVSQTRTPPPPKSVSSGGILESWGQRGENIAKDWSTKPEETGTDSFARIPGRVFRTAGQVAGGINDIIGSVIGSGIKQLYNTIPDEAQKQFEGLATDVAKSDIGKNISAGIKTLKDTWGKVKEIYPDLSGNVEAVGNMVGLVPPAYVGGKVIKGAETVTDLASAALTPARTIERLDLLRDAAIEEGFKKAVKPSIVGKGTAALTEKFYDNAKIGTKEIVERDPQQVSKIIKSDSPTEEFSKAIRQTKKDVWADSTNMAREAGEEGAKVGIAPLRNELTTIIGSENVPETAKRAAKKILNDIKSYADEVDPNVAEELIAHFNSRTKGFWKNPDWNKADDAVFMERSANILRNLTNDSIEAYKGPGWQELRNKYGALTAIEKPVTDRANVVARRNAKGLFDIADIYITGEFISALATMNPVQLAKAAGEKFTKHYIKGLNDADKIVSKMFKQVGELTAEKNRLISPQSGPKPKVGPFVKSSEIDNMISKDMRMKSDIESDLLSGQYGEGNIPMRPPVSGVPDNFVATDSALDTAYRISPEELQAMREADMFDAMGGAEIPYARGQRKIAGVQTSDLGIPTNRFNPDLMPFRGYLPSTEVLSGRTAHDIIRLFNRKP